MASQEQTQWLEKCNELAFEAVKDGKHPFAALLIRNGELLLSQANIDVVNHAESTLARLAAAQYAPDFLWECTLYTNAEPCCMCAGTIYWANIGSVVYGISEQQLLEYTGPGNVENPTLSVDMRTVVASGTKDISVTGPVPLESICTLHSTFWHRTPPQLP